MSTRAVYRSRNRGAERAAATRARIVAAVRELLAAGRFHDSTVEEVAEHAGVSRATLYLHFRSRLDLVDGICDVLAPALVGVRESVGLDDVDSALAETIGASMQFWASDAALLEQLYGVVAIDPAVKDFVDRQREDRRSEMQRLTRRLKRAGRLPAGLTESRALAQLMMLTSFETFCELRKAGLSQSDATKLLQANASNLLLA
jgi:AcrR family transcriptional regulator